MICCLWKDGDNASTEGNSVIKNEVDHTFPLESQLPKQEQTANWIASCHKETTKRPLNPQAAEFAPCSGTNSTQVLLLRVTTLQAMQPVKFSGNAADFQVFRSRIRDNLEDGLLSDAQKIEFLPKFVSGAIAMVNQLQLQLLALKSSQWARNLEIEISMVCATLQNNFSVPLKD